MGVPGLSSWLKRRYAPAFVELPAGSCDNLYIDVASILHTVIRRARTKHYFHTLLHRRLDDVLATLQPRQRVVIALDGPAPLAKLLEQRRRRRRESDRAQRSAVAAAGGAAAAAAAAIASATAPRPAGDGPTRVVPTVEALALAQFRPPNPELSTLGLTTGSLLMLEVHSSLAAYICKKLADPATAHLSFELSDSTVKGEGELKILSRLLQPSAPRGSQQGDGGAAQQQQQAQETHLVLGGDSDLLLMALVAGRSGVYILPELPEEGQWSRAGRRHRMPGARWQRRPPEAAPAAVAAAPSSSSSSSDSASEAETDAELSGAESDGEDGAGGGEEGPPLVVFSRDAAQRLWREQHLSDGGSGGAAGGAGDQGGEVERMALDLVLLSALSSGNDYLPAMQGLQLSNKHRPGLWDLYTSMRRQPEWRGRSLVERSPGSGGSAGGDGPTVGINPGMLGALLAEYYRQRFVHMDAPPLPDGGALQGGGGASPVVWGVEGLAAAAAMASSAAPDVPGPAGAGQHRRQITLRGLEAQPRGYLQGLEWTLAMYCSGGVHDYRFAYDMAAPSLPQLLETLAELQEAQAAARRAQAAAAAPNGGASGPQRKPRGGGQRARGGRLRSLQPLLPAACAMALLPRTGRIHAATALRHLMDEGGELEEVYATCATCEQLGQQLGSLSRELEGARAELAATQLHLSTALAGAATGAPGAAAALEALQAEAERQGGEVARLRLLLSSASRSQQEHQSEAHPYKPFPVERLEAAVGAVPLAAFPRRERRLAQFGREFVFCRREVAAEEEAEAAAAEAAAAARLAAGGGRGRGRWGGAPRRREVAAAAAAGDAEVGVPSGVWGGEAGPLQTQRPRAGDEALALLRLQPWVEDCLSFAAVYPRVADPMIIRRSNWGVHRELLPLRPYMQPPTRRGSEPGSSRPAAVLAPSQLFRWRQQGGQYGGGSRGTGLARRQGKLQVPGQRPLLHTPGCGSRGARAVLRAPMARSALERGCTRLLRTLPRMLRAM